MYPIFVYGSLRRGQRYHHHLRGARCLTADARTAPRYTLASLGPYPALLAGGQTAVRGEVYELDPGTLAWLDEFEEHPRVYRRQAIALAGPLTAESYLYIAPWPPEAPALAAILHGDWSRYVRERA